MKKVILCCVVAFGGLGLAASGAPEQVPGEASADLTALKKVVTLQTAALNELNSKIQELETRLTALEKRETQ